MCILTLSHQWTLLAAGVTGKAALWSYMSGHRMWFAGIDDVCVSSISHWSPHAVTIIHFDFYGIFRFSLLLFYGKTQYWGSYAFVTDFPVSLCEFSILRFIIIYLDSFIGLFVLSIVVIQKHTCEFTSICRTQLGRTIWCQWGAQLAFATGGFRNLPNLRTDVLVLVNATLSGGRVKWKFCHSHNGNSNAVYLCSVWFRHAFD